MSKVIKTFRIDQQVVKQLENEGAYTPIRRIIESLELNLTFVSLK